jgi:hypothetical protein
MRGIIKFVMESLLHTDVTELESEEKALQFLKEIEVSPGLIIYDYRSNSYLVEDFVIYLKENYKHIRIIVLVDEVRTEGVELLKNTEQIKLLNESHIPIGLINEATEVFGNSTFLNSDPYCRIDINFLSILDGINKNLYIKIGQEKFVKVFNENDNTNVLDLTKYKDKGIQYLYLQRDTALWVNSQIQNQIKIFLKANNFRFILRGESDSAEKRFERKILRIDDEVHLDSEFKKVIEQAIERIKNIVEKEQGVNYIIDVLKKNGEYPFFTQKINLSSVMSCVLAKQLDWMSKTTMDKLVYASVLCDITLAVKPHLLRIQNISEFEKQKINLTDEEQRIWLSHPKDAASLIKVYFTAAPPDTDSIAFQHHELPDGKGLPLGLRAEKISPLSALFIIAQDFSYYYLTDDEPSIDDFILKCQSRYDFVNFRKVLKSLEKIKRK